jgi:hypothetical protein
MFDVINFSVVVDKKKNQKKYVRDLSVLKDKQNDKKKKSYKTKNN